MPLLLNDAPHSYLAINSGGYLRLNEDVDIERDVDPGIFNWSGATLTLVRLFSITPGVFTWSGQTLDGYTVVTPGEGGDCDFRPAVSVRCETRPRVDQSCYLPRRTER